MSTRQARITARPRQQPVQEAAAPPSVSAQSIISELPMEVDIAIYQGDDVRFNLIVTNPDGTATDLSQAVATAQVRDTPDGSLLATFTCTITNNTIALWLPSAMTTQLTSAGGVWDCQIANPDITTLVAGRITVTLQVTE